MKLKIFLTMATIMLLLTACGSKTVDEITLVDHEKNEVTFPQEKPVLFFFITSYT